MTETKKGHILIKNSWGSRNSCSKCSSPDVTRVLHTKIQYTNLKTYNELNRASRSTLMKVYPRQCEEVFICGKCYDSNYRHNDSLVDNTGTFLYTTVLLADWDKIEYLTVDEAVEHFR